MQFSTDLALMNTQPQRLKADGATRTTDNRHILMFRQLLGKTFEPSQFDKPLLNAVSAPGYIFLGYLNSFYGLTFCLGCGF